MKHCADTGSPVVSTHYCALLRADIVGFTTLTDEYAEMGAYGAEELGALIEQIVTIIDSVGTANGGELVNLAGDAATLMWLGSAEDDISAPPSHAAYAALAIRDALREAETCVCAGAHRRRLRPHQPF